MINPLNIPSEMRSVPRWLCWSFGPRRSSEKPQKIPISATTGQRTDATNPGSWQPFEAAVERYRRDHLSGIGIAFSEQDQLCGLDLDGVLKNGRLNSWSETLVRKCNSYCEISPSGYGVKVFAYGTLPQGNRKISFVDGTCLELYDRARYFTVTGNRLPNVPNKLANVQSVLEELAEIYPRNAKSIYERAPTDTFITVDRAKLVARARAYVATMPISISGHDGSRKCFAAACACFRFGLTTSEAHIVLREFSQRCIPPWSSREIEHKLSDAERSVRNEGSFACKL